MTSLFDPLLVPKGTLKTLAKRMKKHPQGQHLSLAQCQEVMARTFGHASWHALQSYERPDRSGLLLGNTQQRLTFYSILQDSLEAGIALVESLECIQKAAQRTQQWGWMDTAELFLNDLKSNVSMEESFYQRISPYAPIEAFLIKQGARTNGLLSGFQEAIRLHKKSDREAMERQLKNLQAQRVINSMAQHGFLSALKNPSQTSQFGGGA